MNKEEKTVAGLTPIEQIERLVRQRNALWRIIDEFATQFGPTSSDPKNWVREDEGYDFDTSRVEVSHDDESVTVTIPVPIVKKLMDVRLAAGRLADEAQEIADSPYTTEGYNPRTGERYSDDDVDMPEGFEPYVRAAGEPW